MVWLIRLFLSTLWQLNACDTRKECEKKLIISKVLRNKDEKRQYENQLVRNDNEIPFDFPILTDRGDCDANIPYFVQGSAHTQFEPCKTQRPQSESFG